MNVTKDNFADVVAQIEALLPTAAFVAIDEEMTGVSIGGQSERMSDLPAKRYSNLRNVASRYRIIQFGLAIFHEHPCLADMPQGGQRYEAHAFNFYLFPETGSVNMEASAVAFNSQHGMDWNKWIREGIPYVHREAEEKLKEAMASEKKTEVSKGRIVLTKESDLQTTGNAIAALKAWLADETRKNDTEFEVIETNGYLRRVMHEAFASDFPDLIVESRPTATRGISKMFVLRLTEDMKLERAKKLQAEKEVELTKKVGFRKVFDALAKAKKPVIGHAVFMDILFAMSHFEAPLPESFAEFKELLQSLFPVILDTQFLAKSEPFKYASEMKTEAPRSRIALTKESDIQTTGKGIAALKAWLADETRKTDTEFEVIETNGYLRRFMHEAFANDFPDLIVESRPTAAKGISKMFVLRLTEELKLERAKKLQAETEAELTKKVESADPVVKRENRFGSMALGAVYKVFEQETVAAKKAGKPTVDISLAQGHDRYGPGCTSFHEAGYDAYVTGYAFAHMAKEALNAERMSSLNGRTTMWKSLYHLNLCGEDELIAKGIYVHIAGLKGRDEKHLKNAFALMMNTFDVKAPAGENADSKQNGDSKEDIAVRWLDDDSAFVVLPEAKASVVTAMLEKAQAADGANGGLKFTSWNDWLSAQTAPENLEDEPPRKRAKTSA